MIRNNISFLFMLGFKLYVIMCMLVYVKLKNEKSDKKRCRGISYPDYMKAHTFTTYSLAIEAFLCIYFPKCVHGLTPNHEMKNKRRKR